jgi:uncharacterized membrane protein (DUF106 family)
MKFIKRLIELAFFVFLLTLFGKNMDVSVQVKYYGLGQPITVQFWELVLFCVAFGIIIAAIGDFITQLKWMGEKRRMIKTDKEHLAEVQKLSDRIRGLEAENQGAQKELERKSKELQQKSQDLSRAQARAVASAAEPAA